MKFLPNLFPSSVVYSFDSEDKNDEKHQVRVKNLQRMIEVMVMDEVIHNQSSKSDGKRLERKTVLKFDEYNKLQIN